MDAGIQDPMVRALAEKISSLAFQSQFEQFFLDHAPSFTDDKEHRLEYMTIYQQFQQIFNVHMEDFLLAQKLTEQEFFARCQRAIEDDPKADQYLEIVIASMDYNAFFHLMKIMRVRAALEARSSEAKAEADAKTGETERSSSAKHDNVKAQSHACDQKVAPDTRDAADEKPQAKKRDDEDDKEAGSK